MSEEEIEPGLELILPDERNDLRDRLLWGAVLVILTLWAFSPSIWGGYLWDDLRYPLNAAVQRGTDGLNDIWFNPSRPAEGDSPGHMVTPQYYPMTYTSYWLVYQEWGLNPAAEHALNLLLQAGSALLVWEILRRLHVPGAWVAAAIFAIHPLQTESVAWLSERKNVLAGVFFFSSILTYLQFVKIEKEDARPRAADFEWYAFSLLLFICGLLSKSVVCSMPVVVLILLWWKRRLNTRNIALLFPFFILGLAMSMVTSWFELHIVGATGPDWNFTWVQRLLIASHDVWFYVEKLFFPANLSFIYRKWNLDSAQWIYFIAALAVLAILIALVRKTGRGVLAAVLIYLVTLVPALGFVNIYPMRYSYVADHFQYFSGLALIVLAVAVVVKILRPLGEQRRTVGLVLAVIAIGTLSVAAWSRSHIFADSESLWRDVIAKNPDAWVAYENLAGALDDDAEQDLTDQNVEEGKQLANQDAKQAVEYAKKALALRGDLNGAYEHWGRALLMLNQPAAALDKFRQAAQFNPKFANIRNNMAVALTKLNRTKEAEDEYRQGIALPASLDVRAIMRVNLGHLLLDDAVAANRAVLAAKTPADKQTAHKQMVAAYLEAGQQFQLATHDNPKDPNAWYQLGMVLIRMNKDRLAFDAMERAVELDPQFTDAHAKLGMLYDIAGQYAQAGQEYLKVVTLDHNNVDAFANMGFLALKLHHPPEAKELFDTAIKLDPNNAKARRGLAELAAAATRPTTREAATRKAMTKSAAVPKTKPADTRPATAP